MLTRFWYSRDDKRYTEKKNKSERARRKKEDTARLRGIVDSALAVDPRIKRIKQEEKEAREAKKKGKAGVNGAGGAISKEKAEEEKRKAEEEAKKKEEEDQVRTQPSSTRCIRAALRLVCRLPALRRRRPRPPQPTRRRRRGERSVRAMKVVRHNCRHCYLSIWDPNPLAHLILPSLFPIDPPLGRPSISALYCPVQSGHRSGFVSFTHIDIVYLLHYLDTLMLLYPV